MKDLFPEYYSLSPDDFEQMWNEATFVFDANVLLNLYRYTPETSKQLLGIIKELQERIWMPYQFAYEYHNRLAEQLDAPPQEYKSLIDLINSAKVQIIRSNKSLNTQTGLQTEIADRVNNVFQQLSNDVKSFQDEHYKWLKQSGLPDQVSELFNGKVGAKSSYEDLHEYHKLGEMRYKYNIPPGFEDADKDGYPYGDLVGWFQIIEYAKETQKPVLLITNDAKDDWVKLDLDGKRTTHPELVKEMKEKAGVQFYLYNSKEFGVAAKKYIDSQITDEALEEIERVRDYPERSISRAIAEGRDLDNSLSAASSAVASLENATKLGATYEAIMGNVTELAAAQNILKDL